MSLVALTSSTTLNRREAVQLVKLAVSPRVSYRLSQSVWQTLLCNKKRSRIFVPMIVFLYLQVEMPS